VVFEVSLDYIWHMDEFGDAHFSILLGGTLTPTPRLLCQIAGSRVIAADGGILHAETLAVSTELWVGDFDSTPDAARKRFDHVSREEHPTDKDRTDGEIAIEAAIARGAKRLTLPTTFSDISCWLSAMRKKGLGSPSRAAMKRLTRCCRAFMSLICLPKAGSALSP